MIPTFALLAALAGMFVLGYLIACLRYRADLEHSDRATDFWMARAIKAEGLDSRPAGYVRPIIGLPATDLHRARYATIEQLMPNVVEVSE